MPPVGLHVHGSPSQGSGREVTVVVRRIGGGGLKLDVEDPRGDLLTKTSGIHRPIQ